MAESEAPAFIQCERRISTEEIGQIKETVELYPHLSQKELVACQLCNIAKNMIYFLHNQPGRIGYEEIHGDVNRR